METRILNYFLVIARLGTISAAARELHISQPTLSRQIQQLEMQLGVPLFKREQRQMILTTAGRTYRQRVQQVLTQLNQANLEVALQGNDLAGEVRVGCVESAASNFIAKQVAEFHHHYPNVSFSLYDADGEEIKERLDQGLLDLGIVSAPISTIKYHTQQLPVIDHWGLLVRKDSPLAKRPALKVVDLQNLPLIIPHRSLIIDEIKNWLQRPLVHLNIIAETNLLANAERLVTHGLGNAICIEGAAQLMSGSIKFIPFIPQIQQKHFLIWRKNIQLTEHVQRFIQQLKTN